MGMKIKLKRKRQKNSAKLQSLAKAQTDNLDSFKPLPKTPKLDLFIKLYGASKNFTAKHRVLRQYYDKLFQKTLPNKPLELIRVKIAYQLYKQDFEDANIPITKSIFQNIKASSKFDIEGFMPNLKQLVKIFINNEDKENTMAKKKAAVKAGNAAKVSVAHFYLEVFEKQEKAQLTDVQIADFIEKQSGKRPTEKSIASYRCMYNAGKINGQSSVPKERVKAFRSPKVKAEKAIKPKATKKKKLVLKKKAKSAVKKVTKKVSKKRK